MKTQKEIDDYFAPKDGIDEVITYDPTLKFILRDAQFDANKFTHQVDVMCGAIKVALGKWLDKKYPTNR